MTARRPPRLAERLIGAMAQRDAWTEVMRGDLREEHAALVARRGAAVADAWYWLQTITVAAGTLADRARRIRTTSRSVLFLGDRPMSSFLREIARATRALARQPLVTLTIVLTLGLGLGVNAAAFQLVNAFVIHPLPGVTVDHMTMVSEAAPGTDATLEMVAPGHYYEWKRDARSFDRLAVFDWWQANLAGDNAPQRVLGFYVTADLFPMLGIVPAAGRFFVAADEDPGASHVVVLSNGLWRRSFGARADIVGQPIRVAGETYTVIGIAPPSFTFPYAADLWGPYARDPDKTSDFNNRGLTVIGHLAPGVTIDRARQELSALYTRSREIHPHDNERLEAVVRPLDEGMRDIGSPQVVMLIQVGAMLVLLIGGTNIANLLIARGWDRQRETAVRLAIGASRGHVLRQFVIESLVIGVPAVPLALVLASIALRAMRAAMPARIERFIPGWTQVGVDWRLGVVTFGAAIVAAVLFSIVPAWQTSRPALVQALGQGGRTMTGGARRQRFRRALVITEIAMALPLLVAAGLATMAAGRLATGPQGYDPTGVVVMQMQLPEAGFTDASARRNFNDRLLARVATVSGVQSAGTVNHLPSSNSSSSRQIEVEGLTLAPSQPKPSVVYRVISPGYLEAMRIPILRGRDVTPADREKVEPVAIVSAAMANQFWPGDDPIGRRLKIAADDSPWYTVVGVAGNIIDDWFDRRNASTLYLAMAQQPQYSVELAVRASGDPASIAPNLRGALRDVDPFQPAETMLMTTLVGDRTVGLRLTASMMGVLGGLALVLAAIGIYALMSYYVSQRRQEIGVRLALGASKASVVRLTVAGAGRLTAAGVIVGLVLAILLARVMESALFGAVAAGPSLFIVITATLAVTALIASLVPARQAASVDPTVALRTD